MQAHSNHICPAKDDNTLIDNDVENFQSRNECMNDGAELTNTESSHPGSLTTFFFEGGKRISFSVG